MSTLEKCLDRLPSFLFILLIVSEDGAVQDSHNKFETSCTKTVMVPGVIVMYRVEIHSWMFTDGSNVIKVVGGAAN